METKQIVSSSFATFLLDAEALIKQGFSVSTDTDKFPVAYVGHYEAILVRAVPGAEAPQEDKTPPKQPKQARAKAEAKEESLA